MFIDRQDAGRKLAQKLLLTDLGGELAEVVILGVARGGVVLAAEAAKILDCPLDILVTRKIGAPGNPELALGAVAKTKESCYLNEKLIEEIGVKENYLKEEIYKQQAEILRREKLYRQKKKPLELKDKTVVIIDDGAATGATLIAAAREVWRYQPKKVILALPVAPKDTLQKLAKEVDKIVVLETPTPFFSVAQFYQEFKQVSDEEVVKIISSL